VYTNQNKLNKFNTLNLKRTNTRSAISETKSLCNLIIAKNWESLKTKQLNKYQGTLTKREGSVRTVDLLIKIGCLVKKGKKSILKVLKAADLNYLGQGGQLY
jgi:hypothetical protein